MTLTIGAIQDAASDDEVYDLLAAELQRRLPDEEGEDLNLFASRLVYLPAGLRAMAATYQLDVSIVLDDLGCHFANWHSIAYARETLAGLRELNIMELADIFEEALGIAQAYWSLIGEKSDTFQNFVDWYYESDLYGLIKPLDDRVRAFARHRPGYSFLDLWVSYAKERPERLVDAN